MKVLIVIDMQVDFITGSLANKDGENIIPQLKKEIDKYLNDGQTVIFTKDTHCKEYLQTQEGKKLPVEHCIKGTKGWEIVPELHYPDCLIFEKPSFGSLNLSKYISEIKDVEDIELTGVCTDICVISNAMILKAQLPETPINVKASCCAGTTAENHQNALKAMDMCQINIIED